MEEGNYCDWMDLSTKMGCQRKPIFVVYSGSNKATPCKCCQKHLSAFVNGRSDEYHVYRKAA